MANSQLTRACKLQNACILIASFRFCYVQIIGTSRVALHVQIIVPARCIMTLEAIYQCMPE